MSFPFSQNNITDGGTSTPSFGGSGETDDIKLLDPVVLAATTIQNAFRGYQTRQSYSQMQFDHVVRYFKGQSGTLVKHLIQVTKRIQESWRRNVIGQKEQIQELDEIQKIRDAVSAFTKDLNESSQKVNAKDFDAVKEFRESLGGRLESCHTRLNDVCERVGFHNLKKGLSVIMGDDWKTHFSSEAIKILEEMQLIFTPTAYKIATVKKSEDDGSKGVFLATDDGLEVFQGHRQLKKNLPFFRSFRFFEPKVGMDHVHGGEINIPVTHDDGTRQVIVMKGFFDNDPVEISEQTELVGRKRRLIELELEENETIPEEFREEYLKQYSVRDLVLKSASEVVEEMEKDFQLIEGMEGKILPSFLEKFNKADFDRQIKLFGLLLLQKEPRMAIFLYEMVLKEVPFYVETLRNTLHFSLLRKLDLAIEELESTREKLRQLKVEDVPYETRIAHSSMGDDVKRKALDKLTAIKKNSSESDKAQKYLDGLLEVPFGVYTSEPVTKDSSSTEIRNYLDRVSSDLDIAVHGHEKAKEAVLEWIAQRISNGKSKGECIALEGPPGNGKTTFAREGIAKALGRPFAFISMGGQTDSSFLVGHGFTYVGSDCGRIVEILKEAKCMDPVIYIDEVDKVSQTDKGRELIGALTALTDFSQNKEFQDRYFSGVKFDLSRALFIFSYNDPSKLDPIFKDRLKVIKTDPLSLKDKIVITRRHLLKNILDSCGFKEEEIEIDDEEIKFLVEQYTFEAGARKLKENLFAIVRAINKQRLIEPESVEFPYKIDRETIIHFRDEPKIEFKKIAKGPMVGMVNGLYATTAGIGGLTIVQVYKTLARERLELTLTGSQGDVMKESMTVARSVAWNLVPEEVRKRVMKGPVEGLHIHAPEGATPKDGPSAGGAITTAIVSFLTGIPIRNDVAMTGEIDLIGRISKIGGLAAKLHGAKRSGVKLALCPRDNAKDLEKIKKKYPELIDDSFQVVMVDTIHDILDHALVKNSIPRPPEYAPFTLLPPSEIIEVVDPMKPVDTTIGSSSDDENNGYGK
ncbi:Lon protease [Waddlia chondrophila 2032/99]|uniref:endopeptidase La n=2 Tax=Waddlia chondrophila TaxID=71667 RepID=D6YSQ4_WADCW|nr:S16 family serine protease [Waddlia chondrophila]ADI39099.1 putative peptidase S16, ATP-dependent protease La [Waddlia chondrophila WSU 86-1044]CCB92212.1 Lon protease [Waddlia chondrophila 2032/99]